MSKLGVPNAIPLVYEFDPSGRPLPHVGAKSMPPLTARYLGKESEWFDYFDADGSGTLNEQELLSTGLCTLEDGPSADGSVPSCKSLLDSIDNNLDGEIDFNEFVRWLKMNTD